MIAANDKQLEMQNVKEDETVPSKVQTIEGFNNNKSNTNNADDNTRTITAIAKHVKEFDFEFILNDEIYSTWFQDISSDESSR